MTFWFLDPVLLWALIIDPNNRSCASLGSNNRVLIIDPVLLWARRTYYGDCRDRVDPPAHILRRHDDRRPGLPHSHDR